MSILRCRNVEMCVLRCRKFEMCGLKFVLAHAQAGVDHDRSRKRPRFEHFDVPEEPVTMFEAGKQYMLHRHG